MKKQIWKYQLVIDDDQHLRIPKGGEVLSIQVQHDVPCLWVLVEPEEEKETRVFDMYGTGHPIDCDDVERKFIGTFQSPTGMLVFHVFERV